RAAARNYRICPRCRPVVTTDGRHHACPFAVESHLPHFDLGTVADPADLVLSRYQQFLDWIDQVLEPEAERRQLHPCRVCTESLAPLPIYREPRVRLKPDTTGERTVRLYAPSSSGKPDTTNETNPHGSAPEA